MNTSIDLTITNIHDRTWLTRNSLFLALLLCACFGLAPMAQALGPDTDGNIPGSNNGEGIGVLISRTTGVWNTGTGFEALNHLTVGNQNTATGLRALSSNTNGGFNTATGVYSLFSNTSGFFNSATGGYSLAHNTIGDNNTANGYGALYKNTIGQNNTANGFAALYNNTSGLYNTATGYQALLNNTEGGLNVADGDGALYTNTNGIRNTAIGAGALGNSFADDNTAIGFLAGLNITGIGNVCIGQGVEGDAGVDFTTWIRNVYDSVASGRAVYVNSDNKIGTLASSRRYKDEIKPMAKASEAILSLRPVSFRYKKEVDSTRCLSFGLIAEEVAQVDPDLVTLDRNGKPETVRYEAINAMLLNEFLKEHRKVEQLKSAQEKQQAMIAQQQKDFQVTTAEQKKDFESKIARQQKQIEALTTGLQKVSDQLELNKAAPRTVSNN
jgi:hypothetical protein